MTRPERLRLSSLLCCGLLLLGGCAMVNDLGMRAVSTKVDAMVLVGGELLAGKVLLVPDRTGRATFEGGTGSIRSCMGGPSLGAGLSGPVANARASDALNIL